MMDKKSRPRLVKVTNSVADFLNPAGMYAEDKRYWRWGDDNLLPDALALMSRKSTTHRRIINDKADYISGKGFSCDSQVKGLGGFVEAVNGQGETLRRLLYKLAFDKCLFGNAFAEAVTDPSGSFLSLYHQDAGKCRLSKDGKGIILHHDWSCFTEADAVTLPLYPAFAEFADGTLRSALHYKDYEPMFEHYWVPSY
ncbi:MAG: phage portal protein, partial [Rikenellaceae bacterium]|nr:phage portal protein [Rikenellaceae bacterium]